MNGSRLDLTISPARLAQSVERQALNLMVVGSIPTVGVFDVPGFNDPIRMPVRMQ